MFGLPKTTEIKKQLPKKAIFNSFKLNAADKRLFDQQISRLSIVAEISPQTVNIPAHDEVTAIYIIHVSMKTFDCDKKNIMLLSKLIDQRMMFALQYEDRVSFATYRAGKVIVSKNKPMNDWKLKLKGLNLKATWDALIADVSGIEFKENEELDEIIMNNERIEKLKEQISKLEKKAMTERQARRKWDLAEEIKELKEQLKGV